MLFEIKLNQVEGRFKSKPFVKWADKALRKDFDEVPWKPYEDEAREKIMSAVTSWMSAEGGEELGGDRLFDYYNTDDTYDFGVHSDLVDFLEQHGQVPEWYDAGTILTYPE